MGIRWHSTRRNGRDGCAGVGDSLSSYDVVLRCLSWVVGNEWGNHENNTWVIVYLPLRRREAYIEEGRAAATLGATIQMQLPTQTRRWSVEITLFYKQIALHITYRVYLSYYSSG